MIVLLLPFQFGCYFFPSLLPLFLPPSPPPSLPRTCNIMLNGSYKMGILVLFLILEERLWLFIAEYDVSIRLVICGLHYVEIHSFYPTFLRIFIINGWWSLLYAFYAFIEMITRFLFYILSVCGTSCWLICGCWSPWIPEISHTIMKYDPFNEPLNSVC